MNPLNDLLTAAGRVPDISPDGLRHGRAALTAALGTELGASAAEADRKPARWLSLRAKTLIGTAVAAAAAAAAATVIAVPSSPADSAGSSAKPAMTAPGAPVTPTMASAPATLTAATVLDLAAQAAGSQPGWPNARYWYSEDQYMCGGKLFTDKVWLSRYGSGVVEKTGPKNGGSLCSGDLFTAPISGVGDDTFGPYTWSQLYALPTDPARLEPKLMADSQNTIYQHPVTAAQWESQGDSFQYVMMNLLTDTPAPPALREALFKIAASIPGVKVTGRYTDSLGRTGTALQLGQVTIVVDPVNGLVLDETNGDPTVMFVTEGPATSEPKLAGPGSGPDGGFRIVSSAAASAPVAAKPVG
jgi:hypothetical protein